jgi:hypothetical protein
MGAEKQDNGYPVVPLPPHKAIYLESLIRETEKITDLDALKAAHIHLLRFHYSHADTCERLLKQWGT